MPDQDSGFVTIASGNVSIGECGEEITLRKSNICPETEFAFIRRNRVVRNDSIYLSKYNYY